MQCVPPGADDRLQRRELGRPLPKERPDALGALPPNAGPPLLCSLSSELSAQLTAGATPSLECRPSRSATSLRICSASPPARAHLLGKGHSVSCRLSPASPSLDLPPCSKHALQAQTPRIQSVSAGLSPAFRPSRSAT